MNENSEITYNNIRERLVEIQEYFKNQLTLTYVI